MPSLLRKALSVLYTVLTPMVNPIIYSLKNQENSWMKTSIMTSSVPRWLRKIPKHCLPELRALLAIPAFRQVPRRPHGGAVWLCFAHIISACLPSNQY
ncbi:hypothetical protein A6R68_18142 [Neotoma lepida]|uniref:G-protein coupled receptors family 1 profile domain-containing protein n=1 Tax=Neotoma lepida TaxID=56216 RepID=A0A1A6HP77_NEOLE|nr:hypothetical protein A6R68_18142 [Neotoma lepida]